MFKELGEFIDNVGRATGRMIGQILSDKDDKDDNEGMMGIIMDDDDEKDQIIRKNGHDIDKSKITRIRGKL